MDNRKYVLGSIFVFKLRLIVFLRDLRDYDGDPIQTGCYFYPEKRIFAYIRRDESGKNETLIISCPKGNLSLRDLKKCIKLDIEDIVGQIEEVINMAGGRNFLIHDLLAVQRKRWQERG